MKRNFLIIAMLVCCIRIYATSDVISIPVIPPRVLVGLGYTNQYDTYLSPLEYHGPSLNVMYNHERFLKSREHVSYQSLLDVQLNTSSQKSNSLRMYGGNIRYDAGWHYNWEEIAPNTSIKAGGLIGGNLGGNYINRSGNNPANAYASVRLSASLGASHQWYLRGINKDFIIHYQADIPIIGASFSPDYEQSYYELYKYGYCRNICLTTPINAFSVRQVLSVGMYFPHGKLTIGYKMDMQQAKLNNLHQHHYNHSFLIGWEKLF